MKAISTTLLETQGIYYDPISHRLRCNDNLINLVVKELLFERNTNPDDTIEKVQDVTGYKGALAKIYHIVHHIEITARHHELFHNEQAASIRACPDFVVVADNATC